MKCIKIVLCLLVFILVFTSSLAISGKYLSNQGYQKTSDRLFEYQDIMEDSLIDDFKRMIDAIDSNKTRSYSDDSSICRL